MGQKLEDFRFWVGETLSHAMGNPREEKLTQPPAIGPQPYRDRPVAVR